MEVNFPAPSQTFKLPGVCATLFRCARKSLGGSTGPVLLRWLWHENRVEFERQKFRFSLAHKLELELWVKVPTKFTF